MALVFTQSAQHWVNHGQASAVDNLAQNANGFTLCGWVYRTANGVNQTLCSKDGAGTTGFNFLIDNGNAEGGLRFIVFRATSINDYQSSGGEVALNTWTFVAATFQDSLSTEMDIYTATLGNLASEVSYAVTSNGSGTPTDDSSIDLYVGNVVRADSNPIAGRIGNWLIFDTRLTLPQIQLVQYSPLAIRANCVLNCDYHDSAANQGDLSGTGSDGTVTGASSADHMPISIWTPRPSMPFASNSLALVRGGIVNQGLVNTGLIR